MDITVNEPVASAEHQSKENLADVESLENNVTNLTLQGNIDGLENCWLTGWLHDPVAPQRRISFTVFEGNTKVASGTADQYRHDLDALEAGDGRYAFKIALDKSLFDGAEHELTIVDEEQKYSLKSQLYFDPISAQSEITELTGGMVKGSITKDQDTDVDSIVVELMIDGNVAVQTRAYRSASGQRYDFSIAVPAEYFDDSFHLFSVMPFGVPCEATLLQERLCSITTPWEHLSGGMRSGSLSALSRVAAFRYKSLQNRMRMHADGLLDAQELNQCILAHDMIVEGYENRKFFPALSLPECEVPTFSIVIPVHNKFELTYHCIASLILNRSTIDFEVIVVDDLSSDETTKIESIISNVRTVKNDQNIGFLLSASAGAEEARGEYVLFLNNDTEVTDGWLDEILATFATFDSVGMVGSKLIYPTGRLQESGGIVWGSGKPWNIGNGQNASDPQYNYARRVDYLSGAAMALPVKIWREVDGFSDEFIPAYYEDTDLAFKVRDAGYSTWYCPASTVIHFEGMSNGTELNAGIKRFQSVNAPTFRKKWRHAYRHNGTEGLNLGLEKDRSIDFRVLVVDHSTPRPDMDAGSYAVTQEITLMQELGCKVTFAPNNMAHMGKYTHALQNRGIECIYAPFYNSVGDFLKDRGKEFDLVYIIRYDVAADITPSIREFSKAKIVLNNCDLHFLRELRAALLEKQPNLAVPLETRDRELSIMRDVDAVLSYNDVEHSVIASHNLNSSTLFKCPWVLKSKRTKTPFSDRDGIAFLGGFKHTPNIESVKYFCEQVMPLLNQRYPNIKFHVYGSCMPPEIEALASENIIMEGFVESLDTVFESCRVFIAPLLSGAGIKGKVLESIAYGVPGVFSPLAVESTGLVHGSNTLVATSNIEWVENIGKLYHDEQLWNQLAASSQDLLKQEYSFENGIDMMSRLFQHLELDPAEMRQKLFRRS